MRNIQKTLFLSTAVLTAGALLSTSTLALDWEVRPRAGLGIMDFQYDQEAAIESSDNGEIFVGEGIEVGDTLFCLDLGVSVFIDNWFIDLALQQSDEGSDGYTQRVAETGANGISWVNTSRRKIDSRELSLSVGYALTDRLGVYGGIRQHDVDFNDRGDIVFSEPLSGISDFEIRQNEDFEQDGFFLGATYGWPIESSAWLNGTLAVDIGVAFLDGKTKKSGVIEGLGETADIGIDPLKGDTVGINLGVSFNGSFTDDLNYTLGLESYKYDYEGSGESSDFSSDVFRLSFTVSYAFGA